MTPPERGDPTIQIVALAADDLGSLPSSVTVDGTKLTDQAQSISVVTWEGTPINVVVEADGFHTAEYIVDDYPDAGRIEFRLEPIDASVDQEEVAH